jgi:hypothetical protein
MTAAACAGDIVPHAVCIELKTNSFLVLSPQNHPKPRADILSQRAQPSFPHGSDRSSAIELQNCNSASILNSSLHVQQLKRCGKVVLHAQARGCSAMPGRCETQSIFSFSSPTGCSERVGGWGRWVAEFQLTPASRPTPRTAQRWRRLDRGREGGDGWRVGGGAGCVEVGRGGVGGGWEGGEGWVEGGKGVHMQTMYRTTEH